MLAKGIVLDDGRRRYILCAIDWCEICNSTYALFCRKIAEGAGTDPARVAVHANHQQAAPVADVDAVRLLKGTKGPPPLPDVKFFEQTADRVGAAAKGSLARLQPFDRIGSGEAKVEGVGSTRRIIGKDGKIHSALELPRRPCAAKRSGGTDRSDARRRSPWPAGKSRWCVCTITPAIRRTSPTIANVGYDFPGIARETLEKKENVFQVYFPGCGGDVLVGKYNDGTPAAQRAIRPAAAGGHGGGDRRHAFRSRRIDPLESADRVKLPLYAPPGRTLAECREHMADPRLPAAKRIDAAMRVAFAERVERPLPMSSLQIGRVHILALSGECLVDYQLFAQCSAPGDFVAVAANADFAPASVCTDRQYEEGGAEPDDANVGPGSETLLKAAIVKLLDSGK